jgi:predicted dehydrogenase
MKKEKSLINNKSISRRDFVRAASAFTAGGFILSSLPLKASAFVGASDELKLAIIGCGNRGTGAVANALDSTEGVKLVAMADIYEDRLNGSYNILSQRNSDKVDVPDENKFIGFDGYKDAISLADVVILTTPTFWRPLHYEEAVRQGKHIFMEKPVAVDPAGVRRVLDAAKIAKQKNLNVVVGLQRRYSNKYREIYNRIQDGEIGDIISGNIYWMEGAFGNLRQEPSWSELEVQIRNQFQFFWTSGGQVLDQLIHNIDVANWYVGSHPVSAQGMGGRIEEITGKDTGQVYDHNFIEYTYSGGVIISAQARRQRNTFTKVAERIVGSKGVSLTQGFGDYGLITDLNENVLFDYHGITETNPYVQEHAELFEAIRNGNVIDNTERAAHTTMTAILGYMATYSGQMMTWDQALNSDMRFYPHHNLQPEDVTYDTPALVTRGEDGYYPVPVPGVAQVV